MFAAHSLPAVTSDITRAPELECRCRAAGMVVEAAERAEVEEVVARDGAKELKLLSLDPTAG